MDGNEQHGCTWAMRPCPSTIRQNHAFSVRHAEHSNQPVPGRPDDRSGSRPALRGDHGERECSACRTLGLPYARSHQRTGIEHRGRGRGRRARSNEVRSLRAGAYGVGVRHAEHRAPTQDYVTLPVVVFAACSNGGARRSNPTRSRSPGERFVRHAEQPACDARMNWQQSGLQSLPHAECQEELVGVRRARRR